MVWPFLVMLAASFSSAYDYYRYAPAVRAVWDREDRYLRYVASCYPRFPAEVFPEAPEHWSSWIVVARDDQNRHSFAARYLQPMQKPETAKSWTRMAEDYADFNQGYEIRNSICTFDPRDVAGFVQGHYEALLKTRDPQAYDSLSLAARREKALALLHQEWHIRYPNFFSIRMLAQQRLPLHHAAWDYDPDDRKTELYQDFKRMYRETQTGPMTRTVPYESRHLWRKYLLRPASLKVLGLPAASAPTARQLSEALGIPFSRMEQLPFPLPERARAAARGLWDAFIRKSYPRRLLRIRVTPALQTAFQKAVAMNCKTPDSYFKLTGKRIKTFSEVPLLPYENSTLWRNFIPSVPLEQLTVLSAEQSWQSFLLGRYGSLGAINAAYAADFPQIESIRFPFREALAVSFTRHGWQDFWDSAFRNYRTVGEFLFLRGRAFGNTVLLVLLSVLASLTVNPLAAYALSRFHLRSTEKILLFLLATMAFPAAVTAIPGFLLIRDLGMLNTFAALVLPTVASGMSIFVLKGFFDALPRELYEAAAIDGAQEWQIFLRITLPMTTPILAVNALNAFIHAYNSWEWALLVCQRQSHWTLAVWMYQMSQQWSGQPWAVMAGFVLVSIPTAVVFIACQKIILRGIVLPSMK